MVLRAGLEPTTLCLEGRCSIQLSYRSTFSISFWKNRQPDSISRLPIMQIRHCRATALSDICAARYPTCPSIRHGRATALPDVRHCRASALSSIRAARYPTQSSIRIGLERVCVCPCIDPAESLIRQWKLGTVFTESWRQIIQKAVCYNIPSPEEKSTRISGKT